LSEVDGAIGDGDHGINMRKGFDQFGKQATEKNVLDASQAFTLLGTTLVTGIGGSMGPLYGSLFKAFGRTLRSATIDAPCFLSMLEAGMTAVMDIGEASPGDKTMLDALAPAKDAFRASLDSGADFGVALDVMAKAAEAGAEATVGMIAKVGRASRLGERSRGVRDAGATSCAIILGSIALSAKRLLLSDHDGRQ
jgi:dihydroxyacetone kinase phosphoprotein-dependent L subunit